MDTDNSELSKSDYDRNKPQQINTLQIGGSSIVFMFPDAVAKVDKGVLFKFLQVDPTMRRNDNITENFNKYTDYQRARYKKIQEYFSRHLLPQKIDIHELPVTDSQYSEIFRWAESNELEGRHELHPTDTIKIVATLQERFDTGNGVESFESISPGYLETDAARKRLKITDDSYQVFIKHYSEVTSALLTNPKLVNNIDPRVIDAFYKGAKKWLSQAEHNPELKAELLSFVNACIKFTSETGGVIDLAGKNNLVVILKRGEYKIVAPDPLYSNKDSGKEFLNARTALEHIYQNIPLSEKEAVDLINALNYVRLVNLMSFMLGNNHYLDLGLNKLPQLNTENIYIAIRAALPSKYSDKPNDRKKP